MTPLALRRVFVVAWVTLGVAGALDHTIATKLLGRRIDLVLPHLVAGYVMFKENPRTARVYEYARADGARHDLADLVATPSPGYARARLFINDTLVPGFYLKEICLRATHEWNAGTQRLERSTDDAFDFFMTEYRVDVDPRSPSSSVDLRCDSHGLRLR